MSDWASCRRHPELNAPDTRSRFSGYIVLVAGGCSGIGRASVERFANDGATVYALDLRYAQRVKWCVTVTDIMG